MPRPRPPRSCHMPARTRPASSNRSDRNLPGHPWLDKWAIRPGDSLVTKLFDEGLATVDAVIAVVSQHSAGKPRVRADSVRTRHLTCDFTFRNCRI
jgi:hypothetical protein